MTLPTRSKQEYATHIPILIGLAKALKIEKVLELGCGTYSTLLFLNQTVFPDLTALDSYDDNQTWLDRMQTNDLRVRRVFVPNVMASVIQNSNLEEYDLIFIDDSESIEERTATIQAVSARRPVRPIIVIHDFEVQAYREAAAFGHRVIFEAFNPQTGVLWNGWKDLSLEGLACDVSHYADSIDMDDVSAWRAVL